MGLNVLRSMTSRDVIARFYKLVEQRGAPQFIKSDNGPGFVVKAARKWIRGFKALQGSRLLVESLS